jgi:TPR repeat protein
LFSHPPPSRPCLPIPSKDVRKAAEQGDATSQFSLGQRYEAGKGGVERDLDEAVEWYRRAAQQDYAKAQTNLGNLYRAGKGRLDKD